MNINEFDIVWVDAYNYAAQGGAPRHKHKFFHFLYVDSGTGEITIAEKSYAMYPGNIYLISPFVDHAFFNNEEQPLKTLEIKFRLNDAEEKAAIDKMPVCMDVKELPVKDVLQTILREKSEKMPLQSDVVNLNFELFLSYLKRCYENLQGAAAYNEDKNLPPKTYPEINRVIDYIHGNLTEDISLEKLAELSGFEKNYFLKKFKRQTKCTPMAYAGNVRIEKAKELLRYSDMNVSQIASVTGFRSVHYFSNVFLKGTGKRPLAYRNQNKPR